MNAEGEDDGDAPPNHDAEPINLLIAKQRNGPANEDIKLTFMKCFTRYESAARVEAEDIPRD